MLRSFATVPPRILMHNGNAFGGGNYRILQPANLLRQHGYATVQAHPQILDDNILGLLRPDVVVLQFQQTDIQIEAMLRYRKTLKDAFMVYEIDDLFWQVPTASVHKATLPPDTKERIRKAAQICDAITVTTERLAQEMRRLTGMKDIRVVPNEIPMQFVNAALAGRRQANPKSTKPRVGWAGGVGHHGDLAIIGEVMKILGDEVHWVFMGLVPHGVDPASVEYHGGVPFEQYPEALGALKLDLALAPLEDNPFNRCKSDLRVLEYGACGFPVLASDVPTYKDCPHIERVAHDANAWAQAILEILADNATREAFAEKLHGWVVAERCLDKNLPARIKALLPRNAVPFSPELDPMPLGKLVTVGGRMLPGVESFSTFQEAADAAPGASILYLRPNAAVNALQFQRMAAALVAGHASVSALSNDCIYPAPTQFAAIDAPTGQKLDMCAATLTGDPITVPCPTGPCVLFSGSALRRYGLPLSIHHPNDVELGFTDWGARVVEGGRTHTMVTNTYIHAGTRVDRTRETVEWEITHSAGWMPALSQNLRAFTSSDPLAKVREDLELAYHRYCYDTPRPEGNYDGWAQIYDTIGEADICTMKAIAADWKKPPHINIIMPTYNTPHEFLMQAIESVIGQSYDNWHLLIADDGSTDPDVVATIDRWRQMDSRIRYVLRPENGHICRASNDALEMAKDGWVVFLDHDDTLAPHALWMIAKEVVEGPDYLEFIYSDCDKLTERGERCNPYFAPDFNYELLLASNYVTHLAAYRLEGIKAIGGLRVGYEGSQDWDLLLRYLVERIGVTPDRKRVRHIPHVLYHWRMSANSTSANIAAKPYALDAGRKAVLDHLRETSQLSIVSPNPQSPICTMVRFLVPDPAPKVSIIIPTRDNAPVLHRCLNSLLQRTAYPNYEIIVVDNGSKDPATLRTLTEASKHERVRIKRHPGPFNYSAMNNEAAAEVDGDFLCLLNDDTEIVEAAWLNDMVGIARRPGVGAVGAKLIYPNGSVQQNGIMIDWNARPGSRAMHAFQQLPVNHPGQASRNLITQEWTALTGACMVVSRSLYLSAGGLDADEFPVDYNDVDFCLRLYKAGFRNIVSAQALVTHHEGVTKKRHASEHAMSRVVADEERLRKRHGDVFDGQWNRNLMFHPHMDKASVPGAEKPWKVERERVLIINGTRDDAIAAWRKGHLPFCATLNGHALHMTFPHMAHVKPLDVRGPVEPFAEILGMLEIPRIVFCGVGNGTLGSVGFLTALSELGWPMEYSPTPAADNRDPYVDARVWAAAFERLLDVQKAGDALV